MFTRSRAIGDVYQVRRALEPELAASLAGTLSQEQLARLEEIVAIYAEPPESAEQERDQHIASLAFHGALAEFSRNTLLSFVIGFIEKLLSDITVYRQLYTPHNLALWESGLDYHRRLIAALREGDSGAARAIMKAHMETAWTHMGDQEAKALRGFLPE